MGSEPKWKHSQNKYFVSSFEFLGYWEPSTVTQKMCVRVCKPIDDVHCVVQCTPKWHITIFSWLINFYDPLFISQFVLILKKIFGCVHQAYITAHGFLMLNYITTGCLDDESKYESTGAAIQQTASSWSRIRMCRRRRRRRILPTDIRLQPPSYLDTLKVCVCFVKSVGSFFFTGPPLE